MKNILFLGQKTVGERCFEILLQKAGQGYAVAGICSNPNTNVWWKSNNIYQKSQRLAIPFISNEKRNEDIILALIKSQLIDILISVQHPWILPENILKAAQYKALNLHNAKLPAYKGYNTVNHAIINGEQTYTSTIHWMIKEVDQGAVAFEETVSISNDDTAISLYQKSCDAGIMAFEKLVECLAKNKTIPHQVVSGQGHFYAKADLEKVREIENPTDQSEISRKARGLFYPPYEPAFYRVAGQKIYVLPRNYQMYVSNLNEFLGQFKKTEQDHFDYIILH